jgi:hypothetical protein
MPIVKPIVTVDWDTPENDFLQVYDVLVGEIFRYTKNPETLYKKIADNIPETLSSFVIRTVDAGTPYYTTYGPDCYIVVEREEVPIP